MTPTSYSKLKRAAKKKRLARNPFSSIPKKTVKKDQNMLLRDGGRKAQRVMRKPWKRKPGEFARIYGSRARVRWVKSLPCVACGVVGYSENAHVASGGVGRKADASQIVPLCGPHLAFGTPESGRDYMMIGCHRRLHKYGQRDLEKSFAVDLDAAAAATEAAWQAHIAERTA